MSGTGLQGRNWVLAAMIFAVAMTFIDQTIVSIAVPSIQRELSLSSTQVQWVVNGYLLALAAFFALGGRLSDIFGHTKLCVIGVVVFVGASVMCGLTPKGSVAAAWIIGFRVVQGVGGAIMFPAALAIVVNNFPLRERGRALALFFGIAGGLTALGPVLGGYLTEWTWRAIFWVNVPVAVIALVLIAVSKPKTQYQRAPIDYRGAILLAIGIGLTILGLQQSAVWGWSSSATWICIVVGVLIIVLFGVVELRTESPLIAIGIFKIRPFFVENVVLLVTMIAFIPMFFFASEYAQIALHKKASEAGIYLLFFFLGFVVAAQIGGRILDREGAKRAVVLGAAIAAVGYGFWASKAMTLSFSQQQLWVIVAGFGMGMLIGPANTDAVNRASSLSYGEATGITQTVRNFGASLGLAALGTALLFNFRSELTDSFRQRGIPGAVTRANAVTQQQQGGSGTNVASIPHYVAVDFAHATSIVLYVMCGVMAFAGVVALFGLERGRQEETSFEVGEAPSTTSEAV
ncbi:MAG TPA: MFS transporter [Acidimicrobiales bacterium]|jgi:EmrB/QacA subfamily drug resistance transporter|nr:MFS transporter [Acidimicrobiales bacterium]